MAAPMTWTGVVTTALFAGMTLVSGMYGGTTASVGGSFATGSIPKTATIGTTTPTFVGGSFATGTIPTVSAFGGTTAPTTAFATGALLQVATIGQSSPPVVGGTFATGEMLTITAYGGVSAVNAKLFAAGNSMGYGAASAEVIVGANYINAISFLPAGSQTGTGPRSFWS